MFNILFVDDNPDFKVDYIIDTLNNMDIEFKYHIEKSVNSALRYIRSNVKDIDLSIIDLGLPLLGDGTSYNEINGLDIVRHLCKWNPDANIIINSSTDVPPSHDFLFKKGYKIVHVDHVNQELLEHFLKKD